jgi:predicted CXXCH cytochrome family protein
MKTALILVILCIVTAGSSFAGAKHECSYCHVSVDTAGAKLRSPLSGLCLECHPDRKSPNEHKVDIVPPMKVEGLPLDKEGKMTCVTCHDPHEETHNPMLLRVKPSELCLRCHFRR